MAYNKLLEKQIKKHLPIQFQNEKDLLPFLNSISDYFNTFEKDKKIKETKGKGKK